MVKINELSIENVKRVRAVRFSPAENGLTVIGGDNNQGKTSVLDAIAWALGGDKFRPSNPQREGSVIPPNLRVELSNGLIVERKGKNSSLTVTDPHGNKSGQQLLNEFVNSLALDLPKFMNATGKEKANTLLQIIGVGDRLGELERKENEIYMDRRYIGQTADRKKKFAEEMPSYPGVPEDPIEVSELIRQQQDILARNGENQRLRARRDELQKEVEKLTAELANLSQRLAEAENAYAVAKLDATDLEDMSTAELEQNILDAERINNKIRANLEKQKAEDEAHHYEDEYNTLTAKLEEVREEKHKLLESAPLPLEGLSVEDGELIYRGAKWDGMSGSDQLKVATAIVRALNPNCGFVLMDKLEELDHNTLKEFGKWVEDEGLQIIATRVSTGKECTIIISDGYIENEKQEMPSSKWEVGVF